jgi:p-cumate 2,3-dioxygenase beta subunit
VHAEEFEWGVAAVTQATKFSERSLHELRAEVEDFLYYEAALLDEWRLDEWVELFTPDNLDRIRGRATRLKSRRAHREFPWSRTRRLITNVRVLSVSEDEIEVTANFLVIRIRGDLNEYVGRYIYRLVHRDGSFGIRLRRAELDLESLRPHGTVSILL